MTRPLTLPFPWAASRAAAHPVLWADRRAGVWAMIVLTGVGFGLRLLLLDSFPLREDEAIYAYWARRVPQDPWFLTTWPDKPPLMIWLLAGVFALLEPSAAGARLLSVAAATLTIPLSGALAAQLWGDRRAGALAALLVALNPYAISFASTVYTDTLLVLWGTAAGVAALYGRGGAAGLLVAAACMTKQQGVLYVPLTLALLWHATPGRRGRSLAAALGGAAVLALPILAWDSARWAVAPSPWDLARRTYAPLIWVAPVDWPTRAAAWLPWLWYLTASGSGWLLVALGMGGALVAARRRPGPAWLLLWGGGVLLTHGVTSVQTWDRYLLPLAPWLAWVCAGPLARGLLSPRPTWPRRLAALLLAALLLTLPRPALDAAQGRYPIGADHGDYAGLDEAVAWVQAQPGPVVVYHQVLGWHLRFYLFDDLQPRGDDPGRVELRWYPSAAYLADNAAKTPYPPTFLILPDWGQPRDLMFQLAGRGLTATPRLDAARFTVLEIAHLPRPACDWCVSRPRSLTP